MPACVPIRMGVENHVPDAVLTASPVPVTPVDFIKNEHRARKLLWKGLDGEASVTGVLSESQAAQYVALPGSSLNGLDKFRIQLFSDVDQQVIVYDSEYMPVSDLIPLGVWRAGIDPFGAVDDIDRPDAFVFWLELAVIYRSFRLLVEKSDYTGSPDVSLRMLLIGNAMEMERNFQYGGFQISFLSPPDLIETASGSFIPARAQRRSRRMQLTLPMMTDNDRAGLWRMEVGLLGRPFIVSAFPNEDGWRFKNHAFLARFRGEIVYGQTYEGIHTATLSFVEV